MAASYTCTAPSRARQQLVEGNAAGDARLTAVISERRNLLQIEQE